MNQNYSNDQFLNFQTITNQAPQSNLGQTAGSSTVNFPYMTLQNQRYGSPIVYSTMAQYSQPQQTLQLTSVNTTVNPVVQDNFVVKHPFAFFYQPPNDLYNYCIKCKEISVTLLNEFNGSYNNQNVYVFFHQQHNRIYQIVCEIVSPSLIIKFLNKAIYGIEIEQNIGQELLTFTFDQKENLKFYLSQYLNCYLLN
jgi:hypothetical protein